MRLRDSEKERSSAARLSPLDAGVGEVLATVLLTGITIALFASFGFIVMQTITSDESTPSGSFSLQYVTGARYVNVTFVSGSAFDLPDVVIALRMNNSVGDAESFNVIGGTGTERFEPGEKLRINLTTAAPIVGPGTTFEFLVTDRGSGKLVGMTRATVLTPNAASALFVTSTFTLANAAVSPTSAAADGNSVVNITVNASHSLGSSFIGTITANLSALGGGDAVPLVDTGAAGDVTSGDGTFTLQFLVPTRNFTTSDGSESLAITLNGEDAFGKTKSTSVNLLTTQAPLPKLGIGATYRNIPASDRVAKLNLSEFVTLDDTVLDNDQIVLLTTDLGTSGSAWQTIVRFGYNGACGSAAGVVDIHLKRVGSSGNVTYTPASGCFSLGASTVLDLLNPALSVDATTSTQSWNKAGTEATHRYSAASVTAVNRAVVTFFGDARSSAPSSVGISHGTLKWERSASSLSPPSVPLSFVPTAGTGQVSLSWSAPASDGGSPITNYLVYAGTTSGNLALLDTIGTNTSYVAAGLTNGVTHYFQVSAMNSAGEGAKAAEVSATPTGPPTVPQSLTPTATNKQVKLTWSAPASDGGSAITNYKIYSGTVSESLTLLDTIGTNTSYVARHLSNGVTYYFQVSAVNALGESVRTAEVSGAPSGPTVTWFLCPPTSSVQGNLDDCSNLQHTGLSDADLYETTSGNPRLADIRMTGDGTDATGVHTLELMAHQDQNGEDFYLQVSTNGGSSWTTLIMVPADVTSHTLYTAVMTDEQFAAGSPFIRFADDETVNGDAGDNQRTQFDIAYVRVVTS